MYLRRFSSSCGYSILAVLCERILTQHTNLMYVLIVLELPLVVKFKDHARRPK